MGDVVSNDACDDGGGGELEEAEDDGEEAGEDHLDGYRAR